MKLETLKVAINNLPNKTFQEFYQSYVLDTMDMSIEYELKFFVNNNFLSSMLLDRQLDTMFETLVRL